jgi:hypothetical protein
MSRKDLKIELKKLATDIRTRRYWDGKNPSIEDLEKISPMYKLKFEARHKHIAYCLIRGRTYEQIERKTRTEPDWIYINKIKEIHTDPQEVFNHVENVCVSS